ncbi:hypothetical protein CMI47_11220 [Candidatus Pacearchaeota archaeon]|nr:hypothetical protein [Candidatus Pacearchaeota archaeon]|tara:strand:- start:5771 stop:6481 length:711 start_codon:yes stop_codon:yes gene_type:complete
MAKGSRGKKACPECQMLVGVRTSLCPGCEHEFVAGAKDRKKAESNKKSAGKGKKYCPDCDEIIGAASRACPHCGFKFAKADKPKITAPKPAKEAPDPEPVEDEVIPQEPPICATPSLTRLAAILMDKEANKERLNHIAVPAGHCPVTVSKEVVENPTKEAVVEWANKVIDHGLDNTESFYCCSAIQYWAGHFWDRFDGSETGKTVVRWISEEFDPQFNNDWTEDVDAPEEEEEVAA